jgi:SlyX protein
MREKNQKTDIATLDADNNRIRILEEKFEYQDETIEALNDVIIEQQAQLDSLEDKIRRLEALFNAIEDSPAGGEEPPPPHY